MFIPQEENPDINFVGLLIGPRGKTLKELEKDVSFRVNQQNTGNEIKNVTFQTGAKIIIRGKGSVKEGKIINKDGAPLPGEDEQLHAYITGPTIEVVAKAVEKVRFKIRNQTVRINPRTFVAF